MKFSWPKDAGSKITLYCIEVTGTTLLFSQMHLRNIQLGGQTLNILEGSCPRKSWKMDVWPTVFNLPLPLEVEKSIHLCVLVLFDILFY